MNAKRVNAAADVICRAMKQGKTLPTGWATALEAACMLQSPETAAEMVALRARVAELEAERHTTNEALSDAAEELRARRDQIAERDAQIVAWLGKKAREYGTSNRENRAKAEAVGRMADKLSRSAVPLAVPHRATAGELAEQRHLLDDHDHDFEVLAPRTTVTIETSGSVL